MRDLELRSALLNTFASEPMARPKKNIIPVMTLPPKFKGELFAQLETGKVEIAGLGTFEIVKIPQKRLYHNFSGKNRVIKGYRKLKFVQSHELKASLTDHA